MTQTHCIEIFASILFCIKGTRTCDENICLTWHVTKNELSLTCKIDSLHLGIFVDDPFGKTQAECFPPIPYECEAYYKNGSILHNQLTKETMFTLSGNIDHRINGKWTCRHGTNKDKAIVYVLWMNTVENTTGKASEAITKEISSTTGKVGITSEKENVTGSLTLKIDCSYFLLALRRWCQQRQIYYILRERCTFERNCECVICNNFCLFNNDRINSQRRTVALNLIRSLQIFETFISKTNILQSIVDHDIQYGEFRVTNMTDANTNKKDIQTSERNEELIYYIIASISVLLLVISIILCRVLISGRYKIIIIKTSNIDIQNCSQETAEIQSPEDLTVHYETINENELIHDAVEFNHNDPFQENNLQISTTDTYLICRSSVSTCSSEYEDIGDFCCNQYQSLDDTREDADLHTYCTTTAACDDVTTSNLYLRNKAERCVNNKPEVNLPFYKRTNNCTHLRPKCKSDDLSNTRNIERFNSLSTNFNVFNTV